MPAAYDIQAKQRLIDDLINADIQFGLVNNTLQFSPPTATSLSGRNTEITINVFNGSSHVNCLVSHYNREYLTDVLSDLNIQEMDLTGFTTTHDLLPAILATYQINLSEEDIVLEDLATNGNRLNAASGSYGWLGSFEFTSTILEYPPLIRSRSEFLLITRSGKLIRRLFPTYPTPI